MTELSHKRPPSRSKSLVTDVLYFILHKPGQSTLIKFDTAEARDEYNQRVMQRIGIDPNRYSVLNIHKIGVEAPLSYVFNELLQWNGDSTCWPNHIAKVDRIENDLKRIKILLFGLKRIPLFLLNALCIKDVPDCFDFDNARYLLYECSGGYPIGIYAMYVRSSIPELGETSQCQLIFAVGFNFYGKEDWQKHRMWINKLWEMVHNRVTANVLNRIKQLGEWRIDKIERTGK